MFEVPSTRGGRAFVLPTQPGRLELRGADALDLLHRISTNDLRDVGEGTVARTVLTNPKGRIVDYVKILRFSNRLLLLTSPEMAGKVRAWIERFIFMEDVRILDITSSIVGHSLAGAEVDSRIVRLLGAPLQPNTVTHVETPSLSCVAANDFDFGVSTVHLIADASQEISLKKLLRVNFDAVDQQTYDSYRISRGIPATGCELTDSFNPFEAGLRHAVCLTKGCYIGQEVLARLDTYGKARSRGLVGLQFAEPAFPDHTRSVLFKDSQEVGLRTSFSAHPVHGRYLGLGIVASETVRPGDRIWLSTDGKRADATVMEFPFGH